MTGMDFYLGQKKKKKKKQRETPQRIRLDFK